MLGGRRYHRIELPQQLEEDGEFRRRIWGGQDDYRLRLVGAGITGGGRGGSWRWRWRTRWSGSGGLGGGGGGGLGGVEAEKSVEGSERTCANSQQQQQQQQQQKMMNNQSKENVYTQLKMQESRYSGESEFVEKFQELDTIYEWALGKNLDYRPRNSSCPSNPFQAMFYTHFGEETERLSKELKDMEFQADIQAVRKFQNEDSHQTFLRSIVSRHLNPFSRNNQIMKNGANASNPNAGLGGGFGMGGGMNANAANASIQQQSPMFIFHSVHDRLWRDAEHVAYVKKIPVFPQPVVSILKAADDKGPFQSSLNVRIDWQKKKAASLDESLKKLHDQLHMIRTKLKTSQKAVQELTIHFLRLRNNSYASWERRKAQNWDLPTRPSISSSGNG